MSARIIKLSPPIVKGMTVLFLALLLLQNSKGNSFSGGMKYMGEKNLQFLTEITIYL